MQAAASAAVLFRMRLTPAALRASQRLAAHAASTAGPLRPSARPKGMKERPAAQVAEAIQAFRQPPSAGHRCCRVSQPSDEQRTL